MTSDSVGIVGAGPFGTALGVVVARAGGDVLIWSRTEQVVESINQGHRNPERTADLELPVSIRATANSAELGESCRFIVVAVASFEARARLRSLGDSLGGHHILVHAIGSLAGPSDVSVSQLIQEETPVLRVGALAGPALPADLAAGRVGSMVCASPFSEVTEEAQRLLGRASELRLYRSSDVAGVEFAAALAGVYTMALGAADGLGIGGGTRAVLVTRSLAEMTRLGMRAGGQEATFRGLAGLGNLLVRSSAESGMSAPAYRFGHALAEGKGDVEPEIEAVRALRAAIRVADRIGDHAPIARGVLSIVDGKSSAAEAAQGILETVAGDE